VTPAVDLDDDHVVGRRAEALDHASRGLDRDVMLARPAAEEHRDAAPGHGVVVVVVVSVVVGVGGVGVGVVFIKRPMVSVTTVF